MILITFGAPEAWEVTSMFIDVNLLVLHFPASHTLRLCHSIQYCGHFQITTTSLSSSARHLFSSPDIAWPFDSPHNFVTSYHLRSLVKPDTLHSLSSFIPFCMLQYLSEVFNKVKMYKLNAIEILQFRFPKMAIF